jgi:hypothetical protein
LALGALTLLTSCGACGGGGGTPAPPVNLPTFDSTQAFSDLETQCAFGPRNPDSAAHGQQLAWMKAALAPLADKVVDQSFSTATSYGGPYNFDNVIALFGSAQPGPVMMLCAHWDTRPVADEDPDPANRTTPILGANDGASGVAIMMEMARLFHAQTPPHPVELIFLDAEDSGKPGSSLIYEGFCLGTVYLVENWPAELPKPPHGILLDLVGGMAKHDVRLGNPPPNGAVDYFDLPEEQFSLQADPVLVDQVWTAAAESDASAFRQATGQDVVDDHMVLTQGGIPSIDIIQTPFPPVWHTIDDTVEYCQASALDQVGKTLVRVLYAG